MEITGAFSNMDRRMCFEPINFIEQQEVDEVQVP